MNRVPIRLRVALIGFALALAFAGAIAGQWLVVVVGILVVAGQLVELRGRARRP